MSDIDWRKVLVAYIAHVADCESIDYLSPRWPKPKGLTAQELDALDEAAVSSSNWPPHE